MCASVCGKSGTCISVCSYNGMAFTDFKINSGDRIHAIFQSN